MSRSVCALAIAVAVLPGRIASAEAEPIAVLAVEIAGDAAPELRPRVADSIAVGLTEAGRQVVRLSTVMEALAEAPELIGCTSTACLERISERVGAREFVRARLRADGVTYNLELEHLSAADDDALASELEADCTVCTMTELFEWVSATAAELLLPERTASAAIVVETDPPGATVEIGGREIGRSPAEAKLPVGHHDITATLDGHDRAATTLRVEEGDPGPHVINLVLLPHAASAEPITVGKRYSPWKWMVAGGATASLATSAALLATHGNPTCELEEPQTQCPRERDGITPGLITLGLGAALGGVSGWMFYRDATAGRRVSVGSGPSAAGGSIIVRF